MAIDADRAEREPALAPTLDPVPTPAAPRPTPLAPPNSVLLADSTDTGDLLGVAEAVRPLAELCLSSEAQTPFLAGIIGPAGSGKSFALRRLVDAIDAIADAAAKSPGGPFLSRVVIATVDAAAIEGDPASALASAAFVALERERAGVGYAALADEAAHATTDPRRAALAAADHLDDILRRLEGERAAREEVEAKRARLAEALLYETPGSRVDAFVRISRGTIESRLRRFGLGDGGRDSQLSRSRPGSIGRGREVAVRAGAASDLGLSRPDAASALGLDRVSGGLRRRQPSYAGRGREVAEPRGDGLANRRLDCEA